MAKRRAQKKPAYAPETTGTDVLPGPDEDAELRQQELGDWQDQVPDDVKAAAEEYDKAHVAKGKALGKLNSAKETVIAKMKANGITRCRIRNGQKILTLEEVENVKIKKPTSLSDELGEDDEDDDE